VTEQLSFGLGEGRPDMLGRLAVDAA